MKNYHSLRQGNWQDAILASSASIQEAVYILNVVSLRIVLVVDGKGKLEGTISDGDIRRGLLRGIQLDAPVKQVLHRNPLVVGPEHDRQAVVQLMAANEIQQIPIVDARRRVIGLHTWDRLNRASPRPNIVVIMAGGEGRRLRPITNDLPKPMVEVGGKPILEHIILKAKQEGFHRFVIAVHHLGEVIERYFGNGKSFGVEINYCREKKPLGTAGALRLLPSTPHPILVTNGDVLADFNYLGLLDFHMRHRAAATMAVRSHEWVNPFGVVETKGLEIVGFKEKPIVRSHINAGVYVLDPAVRRLIPRGCGSDMPEIFSAAKDRGMAILAYPLHEPWLDVGSPEDLAKAKALRTGQS